jgi:hypothetical protein
MAMSMTASRGDKRKLSRYLANVSNAQPLRQIVGT